MSIYDTINKRAAANKAAAWKAYTPLTLGQLGKEVHTHDKAKRDDKDHEEARVVYRQTEIDAIKHALGWFRFMSEDPVIRIEPAIKTRWCIHCMTRHSLDVFEHDKKIFGGLAFGCVAGRRRARVWRMATGGKPIAEDVSVRLKNRTFARYVIP